MYIGPYVRCIFLRIFLRNVCMRIFIKALDNKSYAILSSGNRRDTYGLT